MQAAIILAIPVFGSDAFAQEAQARDASTPPPPPSPVTTSTTGDTGAVTSTSTTTPSDTTAADAAEEDEDDKAATVAMQGMLATSPSMRAAFTSGPVMSPMAIAPGDPRYPLPAEPTPAGLILGTGGLVGNVGGALSPTLTALLNPNAQYLSSGALNLASVNVTGTFQTIGIGGLSLVNLTPVSTAINGTLMGQNQHLTLLGGVTSGSYITNINRGTDGFFAGGGGILLPSGAPAWSSDCAALLGIPLVRCWAVNPAQDNQVIVGDKATANGSQEVVIGRGASHTLPAEDANTVFPGSGRNDPNDPTGVPTNDFAARKGNSVVIGDSASGTANAQTIIGANATSTQVNSVALGNASVADRAAATGYIAFGLAAPQTSVGAVSIGSAGNERQLTHVAAGTDSYDAVNVLQLQGAISQVSALDPLAVTYDPDGGGLPTNSVTLVGAGTGAVGVHNLAAGSLAAGSLDAVNGAQVGSITQALAGYLGGGAAFDPVTAIFTAPAYALRPVDASGNVSAASFANAGDAFTSLDGSVFALNSRVNAIAAGLSPYLDVQSTAVAADATGNDSIALGGAALASGDDAMAAGAQASASAAGAVAMGARASASAAGAVAIGSDSIADRLGGGNEAFSGVAVPVQGVVSVGSAGAERQIANVAGGSADTDAVNVRQLRVVADFAGSIGASAVQYDDASHTSVTLNAGGAATLIGNLAAGNIAQGSAQAINGGQLWEWTQNASNVYSNLALYTSIQALQGGGTNGGSIGLSVNNTDNLPAAAASGGNTIAVGAGSTASGEDSATLGNGAQATASNSVAIGAGSVADRANTVSVGAEGATRQVTNVAAGTAGTDAANVAQVNAVREGSVGYDTRPDGSVDRGNVTLGSPGAPTAVHNVAPGTAATDAANVGQLDQVADWSRRYTDERVGAIDRDIQRTNNRASAGVASAMAMAGLPQATTPGRNMAAVAGGTFRGESGIAVGISTVTDGGGWVYKLSGSANSRGDAGFSVGAGMEW